jgi:hypothetical protein
MLKNQLFRLIFSAPKGNVRGVKALHVMAALHVFVHVALAGAAKRLDRIKLAFLHKLYQSMQSNNE